MNLNNFQKLHDVISERRTTPGAQYYPDPWWEREIDAALDDLDSTIQFIDAECSDEELYWFAEVFDDIMEKTRSTKFLDCFRRRVQRVENPDWKTTLLEDVRTASEYVDETT